MASVVLLLVFCLLVLAGAQVSNIKPLLPCGTTTDDADANTGCAEQKEG